MKQYNFKTKNGQNVHIKVWGNGNFARALAASNPSDIVDLNCGVEETK